MEQRPDIIETEMKILFGRRKEAQDILMRDHAALRLTG